MLLENMRPIAAATKAMKAVEHINTHIVRDESGTNTSIVLCSWIYIQFVYKYTKNRVAVLLYSDTLFFAVSLREKLRFGDKGLVII